MLWKILTCLLSLTAAVFGDYTIQSGKFVINGVVSNKGHRSEGTLMNVRTIQAVFDDTNSVSKHLYPDTHKWDPARQTAEFVGNLSSWKSYGINAFTVGMMGGITGSYTHNCDAWYPNGTLKCDYLCRLKSILDKADSLGLIPTVSFFHFENVGQFSSPSVVPTAIDNLAQWLLPYKNKIIVEVTNECGISQSSLKTMKVDCPNIIGYFQKLRKMGFKVGNSVGGAHSKPTTAMLQNMDVVFLHANGFTNPSQLTSMVATVKSSAGYSGQPIVYNEAVNTAAAVNALVGLNPPVGSGLYLLGSNNYRTGFQTPPTNWLVSSDSAKVAFFNAVKAL